MREWLEEVEMVLRYSRMTCVLLILGVVAFFGVLLLGEVVVGSKAPTGPFSVLYESVFQRLEHRYDKLALIGLVSFWVAAYRRFRKDRKRLLHM